jgi:hypothetical protein
LPEYNCETYTRNLNGSITTAETLKTQAAALEVFLNIFSPPTPQGFSSSDCYYYDRNGNPEIHESVCLDGTWSFFISVVGLLGIDLFEDTSGGWDVVCDSDGDGITDDVDNCVDSDLNVNLVIDECDTAVFNINNSEGCTLSDLINECTVNIINHGNFVSCVAHLTNDWNADTLISEDEKDVIQSCAAMAYDKDKDNILDQVDNCISTSNTLQLDADGDGIGDCCDPNPGCGGCGLPACEK